MSFGTDTYGSDTFGHYELLADSVYPSVVGIQGGDRVVVFGWFPDYGSYYTAIVGGLAAYSGIPGQGARIYPSLTELAFIMPRVDNIGVITISLIADGGDTVMASISAVERSFGGHLFGLRQLFPRAWGVGGRSMEQEQNG